MKQLRQEYQEISVPDELDNVVNQTIYNLLKERARPRSKHIWFTSTCAAALLFLVMINASPTVANALSSIPGVERIIKVLTLKQYEVEESNYNANIKSPYITDMVNQQLQTGLNDKYMKESKALHDQFQAEISDLKKQGEGHLALDVGYEVKTDNDEILSIERYVVEMAGSSSEEIRLDTIGKKSQVLITLPMLFKDDGYLQRISDNIKEQMRAQMKGDPNKFYWIMGAADVLPTGEFKGIKKDQSFYINNNGKLVIVFNKYEVAPGYMGAVEFIIPTKVLKDDLVSNKYIK